MVEPKLPLASIVDINRQYVLVQLPRGSADDPPYGGQRRGTQPECGNGAYLDTANSELGRQLGQAVPQNPSSQLTMASLTSETRLGGAGSLRQVGSVPLCSLSEWCWCELYPVLAVHVLYKKFSGVRGRLAEDPDYACPICCDQARPIDNKPVTQVDVDGMQLDVESNFC